ncbi:hypothetical protein DSM03_11724 [Leeuwenhoekiella aestuarii]|uniref:hypothetical protein n=1 Tax=Leeuwenhoekiella aestuarii TaxID=2249426 RepID=UPI000FFE813B|nr:hypothetical protein [Leeuwenhoekiella aestuarii]RXG11387.1 hypothetical protein DSM03_11724 [Leeuwenhoekiella aestuarii]
MFKFKINQVVFLGLLISVLVISCTTYERILATPQAAPVELGMIGDLDATVTTKEFQTIGIPQLNQKIRLTPVFRTFNAMDFKAYKKLKGQQSLGFTVNYVDSLPVKPQYIRLKIQDQIAVLDELNATRNENLKNQILTNTSADVVTQVDWVLSETFINQMKAADAIFLSQNTNGIPLIVISKNDQVSEIRFSEGLVLSYEVSQFCWGLNKRNEPELMAISKPGESCNGDLKRNGNRLKKSKNLFNY